MWRTPFRSAVLGVGVVAVVLAAASCGGDDTAATTTTGKLRATTTTAPGTTSSTAPTAPTPSTAPGTPAPGATTTSVLEGVPGTTLPDGDQVGYLRSIDLGQGTITVDLAELLTGPAAVAAAREDTGHALTGDPLYIRNRDPKLYTIPVDPSGSYALIFAGAGTGPSSIGLEGLASAIGGDWGGISRPNPPFNLTVQDGRLTAAVQMSAP